MKLKFIHEVDPEIEKVIFKEIDRQKYNLELIASENIVSNAVMEAQGSVLTNKYAEGYPAHRYYGGCEYVDEAEKLAIERAKKLFGAEFVNVQPHSGSQANMGVYFSLLKPQDTVLGMDLSHGGHLTHGSPVNFSGKLFNFVFYGLKKETGVIDYDRVAEIAEKHKPKLIVTGASAYPRIIDFKKFSEIAKSVNAYLMADVAHIAGLIVAGEHPSPIPFADAVTTTTHKTLRGPRGGMILAKKELGKKINSCIFPGIQGGPLMHVIAAKAVAFKEAMAPEFKEYQKNIVTNAKTFENCFKDAGINMVSGGTDNHMLLLDLTNLNITGKRAEDALGEAGITVNKNAVPFDKEPPSITSGIRIGTPALTSRGFKKSQIEIVAGFIESILKDFDNEKLKSDIRSKVKKLCEEFPIYQA